MRLFPILAAIAVSALIYVVLFERDRLTGVPAEATEITEESSGGAPNPGSGSDADSDETLVKVVAIRSTAREVDSAVVLRGQTEADRQVVLRAETAGQVVSEPLRKGTFVKTGEQLCTLDPGTRAATLAEAKARLAEARARIPEAEARVTEAQAMLSEARINDNAAAKLSEGGFASDTRVAATRAAVSSAEAGVQAARSGLESTQAGIQSAEASVAAAQREIERLTIAAPFDGLLESDAAELGSLLQPGDLCATVIQLDPVKLVGFVPELDVARVQLGARARAQLASGEVVEGDVVFLSRSADPTTRTFRVEIVVPNPDLALRDGQTAEIVISAEGKLAHLLPQSALTLNDEGVMGVRIVDAQGLVAFLPVTLLRDTQTGIWLTGLPEQADVIVIGQEYVADGVHVKATYQEASQ